MLVWHLSTCNARSSAGMCRGVVATRLPVLKPLLREGVTLFPWQDKSPFAAPHVKEHVIGRLSLRLTFGRKELTVSEARFEWTDDKGKQTKSYMWEKALPNGETIEGLAAKIESNKAFYIRKAYLA